MTIPVRLAALHLKLEPYKSFKLDMLDIVLLFCLSWLSLMSLVFQLETADHGSAWRRQFWEALTYMSVVVAITAAITCTAREFLHKMHVRMVKSLFSNSAKVHRFVHEIFGTQINYQTALSSHMGAAGSPLQHATLAAVLDNTVTRVNARGRIISGKKQKIIAACLWTCLFQAQTLLV